MWMEIIDVSKYKTNEWIVQSNSPVFLLRRKGCDSKEINCEMQMKQNNKIPLNGLPRFC